MHIRAGFDDICLRVGHGTAFMQMGQSYQIDQTINVIGQWTTIGFVQN